MTKRQRERVKVKSVFRYDKSQKKLRLVRFIWSKGRVGFGGYSAMLSLSLVLRLATWSTEYQSWRVTFMGVQLHYLRSFGGMIT